MAAATLKRAVAVRRISISITTWCYAKHHKTVYASKHNHDVVVKTYGECSRFIAQACSHLTLRQLSKEEEEAMGEEKEVRKEDQDRINRFSRLHSKEKLLEDDLKTKQVGLSSL